ncbi:hypothetical protein [Euzebya pacifica]|nr:hypothetical protein [Euzebya pacifica]
MSPETSFAVLTWMAIAVLTAGLVGCLRALSALRASVEDRMGTPRRLAVGDTIRLPAGLLSTRTERRCALLFVRAGCRSCETALERLTPCMDEMPDAELLVLWQGEPDPRWPGVPQAAEAFEALNVGVVPFFALLEGNRVIARGGLGSRELLDRAVDDLKDLTTPTEVFQ